MFTDFKNSVNVTWRNGGTKYEFREGESLVLYGYFKNKKSEFTATEIVTNHALEGESWTQKSNLKNADA